MSTPHDPNQPYPQPAPKRKRHTFRTIALIVGGLFALLIVAAVLSPGSPEAPVSVTSQATPPAVVKTTAPSVEATTAEPSTEPTAAEGTGCDLDSSPEEYADCLDKFVNGTPATPKATQPAMTAGQEQAVGSAQNYLSFKAFSRKGLIQQLSSEYGEGFSVADATYAVDHITVDWNEQAAKSAESYLKLKHFSRSGLIQQLESSYGEGFTHRQAVYGVTKAGL